MAEPIQLEWRAYDGDSSHTDHLGTDLQGHFWAEARLEPSGRWFFRVSDYQGNSLVEGTASTQEGALAVVQGWNDWVINSPYDPSKGFPEDEESDETV